jgi:endonuclease/exonuclease/phosphatase family metal-dependent hydrolase
MNAGLRNLSIGLIVGLLFVFDSGRHAEAGFLRVATYNVRADTGSPDGGPGLATVLQGIGNAVLPDGRAQPVDVLALQELNYDNPAPSSTLQVIVDQLNTIYGPGTYAYDLVVDPTDANTSGNGPSGLVYNTKTVIDVGAAVIGTASSIGAARAPMRYTLQPVAGTSASQFNLYVSHAKSGTTSSDANRRNVEMTTIRNDSAALGTAAHVIYAGDFNINDSSELSYQTLISSAMNGGVGRAFDPANPANNWTDSASFINLISETATRLQFRDDMQLMTSPTLNDTSGLQLVAGSGMVFANNGSLPLNGAINSGANTVYPTLPNRTSVLNALTTSSDHLPMVADYQFPSAVPEPASIVLCVLATLTLAIVMRRRAG